MRLMIFIVSFFLLSFTAKASYIMLPMDDEQSNHLKAYGITYWVLDQGVEAWWLLNYQGGSFAFPYSAAFEKECKVRDVSFKVIPTVQFNAILVEISNPEVNQEAMKLELPPKIAVYTPSENARGERIQPWDDAVTMVLTYAEIPFESIYDREVMSNELPKYDWLHLHHEDFTGQFGKFYKSHKDKPWYKENQVKMNELAKSLGYKKVSQLKLAVAKKIKEYVVGGGFLFAMCSATDTYDIALAAEGVDICDVMYDGDPPEADYYNKMDYSKTLAFENFEISRLPLEYEHSNIDNTRDRKVNAEQDYFKLFDFSAKWDPIPTMLTQNHTKLVKGYMGQATAFKKRMIKSNVLILGESKNVNEVRYIHGKLNEGTWSFYGGHDPEDYRHYVGDPETDLNLHPNSPGYRLILNNILFPAAKKKKKKT